MDIKGGGGTPRYKLVMNTKFYFSVAFELGTKVHVNVILLMINQFLL